MNQQIFTVSELNNQINNLVESGFSRIIVKGEISGLKPSAHHMYFSIKDDSASLPCAIWSYQKKLINYTPKDGDKVLIEGKPSFWVKGGALKFHVDKISLAGEGDLWAKFQALQKKLLNEGLFDSGHKKELPKYSRKIAVITSITGSVIKDILDVISIVNIILGDPNNYSEYQLWSGDVTGDQIVDILDIIALVNIIFGN